LVYFLFFSTGKMGVTWLSGDEPLYI
jgi:hypothetical protein